LTRINTAPLLFCGLGRQYQVPFTYQVSVINMSDQGQSGPVVVQNAFPARLAHFTRPVMIFYISTVVILAAGSIAQAIGQGGV
tara:strand:+ start:35780 stop:36028 length:249 start_codon:yes stop_codon:yes gene_type:complete